MILGRQPENSEPYCTNLNLSLEQKELKMATQFLEIIQKSQKLDGQTDRPSYTDASQDPKTMKDNLGSKATADVF